MNQPAQRFATYEDLFGLPDNVIGEIIHGQLITQPRPAPKHALCSSAIGGNFSNPYQYGRGGPSGWWIIDEPELHLGPHILVPDLAGWRRERLLTLPDEAYFSLAPPIGSAKCSRPAPRDSTARSKCLFTPPSKSTGSG